MWTRSVEGLRNWELQRPNSQMAGNKLFFRLSANKSNKHPSNQSQRPCWSFYRAIGAYGPVETPVFFYKSYGSVPLFWRVRTQIFLSCKRPFGLPLLTLLKWNILLYFVHDANEASWSNNHKDKGIVYWSPFMNTVCGEMGIVASMS